MAAPVQSGLERRRRALGRHLNGVAGRPLRAAVAAHLWRQRWQMCEWAETVCGLCVFAFWTSVLYHLL
ncbi:unnamed protein product [Ophioblennius macclurei]